ncbi:conjugative transposon protein TraN [Flavobacterium sp. ST-75]|uniref:Conjugative transposon protein TraN n=1 Tax=Flavobacterium rhizophilum TaxID=3163296 RepID=A0ABW8Y9X1_9FLAO
MKIQALKSGLILLFLVMVTISSAQVGPGQAVGLGRIAPYHIEVTYDKTSHIIFPSGIRYVDLGSDNIVAGKAQDADNVLRVKAAVHGFDTETNFSVITEDGQFYGFDVCYSETPQVLGHDLAKGIGKALQSKSGTIRFEELGASPASLTALIMEALYEKGKKAIKHIRSQGYGIGFSLRGIYIHDGKYYFDLQLENTTNIPFTIDYIKFRVIDRKVAKRTVIQERTLNPLRMYRPLLPIAGNTAERNIFLLDVFTLNRGQALEIEVAERNGGRGQVLKIRDSDLVKAQSLDKLRIKF